VLVLTRKFQQQIKIGDQITVTVLRVKGNTVRIGVDAPREVRVVRGELPPEGEKTAATARESAPAEVAMAVHAGEDEAEAVEEAGRGRAQPLVSRIPSRKLSGRSTVPPLRVVRSSPSTVLAK
jgi:carbon storage regulator CsrA